DTVQDTHRAVSDVGLLGVGIIMLRAFSLGGGTYTGIEAVSNGVGILREPRVESGKRTMLYMASSLAFTAGGILLCYLLNRVVPVYTKGSVGILVVMYSINVFLTFTLSQSGMARHWVQVRTQGHWKRRLAINAIGALVTATILVITASLKFREGGWVTLVATSALIALCGVMRRHYQRIRRLLVSLD